MEKKLTLTAGAVIAELHNTSHRANNILFCTKNLQFRNHTLRKKKRYAASLRKGNVINVQVYYFGKWHHVKLKEVWYVPYATTHLFSVKIAAKNGFVTTINDRGIQIREKRTKRLAATGYLSNELYIMNMRESNRPKLYK